MAHSVLRQRLGIVVAWALCMLLAGLVTPTRVRAAQSTTLAPTSGPPNTVVLATGIGWPAGHRIEVWWSDGTTLAQTTADGNGNFQVSFTVPSTATPGSHDLEIRD